MNPWTALPMAERECAKYQRLRRDLRTVPSQQTAAQVLSIRSFARRGVPVRYAADWPGRRAAAREARPEVYGFRLERGVEPDPRTHIPRRVRRKSGARSVVAGTCPLRIAFEQQRTEACRLPHQI